MFYSNIIVILYFSFHCMFIECEGYCRERFKDSEWSWNEGINCNGVDETKYCDENMYWCADSSKCHSLVTPCNGTCLSHVYPIYNQEQDRCVTCDAHYAPSCNRSVIDPDTYENVCLAWCPEKSKCIDVSLDNGEYEACGEKCFQHRRVTTQDYYEKSRFCLETKQCIPSNLPCGSDNQCSENAPTYCPTKKQCQSSSLPCGGKCEGEERYCPRYLVDDFIGDGRGSCIGNDRPCGEQCPTGKHFCLATFSCDSSPYTCPCPQNKWPAENKRGLTKCQLFANETIPGMGRGSYAICTSKDCGKRTSCSKCTYARVGDCHPEYIYCQETKSCVPLLYSSCGYDDWLKFVNLFKIFEECLEENPRRLTLECWKKSGLID